MRVPLVKNITTYKYILLSMVFVGLAMFSATAEAAQVVVSPSTGTYANGQSFTATIQVNPQGDAMNAVEAQISFDNTKLSVVNVSKTGSVFSLWTTEPTFSNTNGTIDFGGGSPSPFSNTSNIITVTFRTLDTGSANVLVSSASALAADGLGTDVYSGSVDASYTISADVEPTPVETPTETPAPAEDDEDSNAAITFGDPPRPPEIGSQTFLDPEVWYATKDGVFIWDIPFDVDAVALDIATSVDAEPETIYDPPIEEFVTSDDNLIDGVQYLTVQFKNQVGWGGILHRKLKIDTLPPEPFTIDVRAGNSETAFPLLTFEANDTTSGIERYEMTIAGGEEFEVTPDEAKLGYLLGQLEDGTYTIRVSAYDHAGNVTESSVPVLITAGWMPPLEIEEVTSFWDLFKGKNLVILLLILLVIALLVYIYVEKKKHKAREEKLRRETKEIQDQMEKIFSALRDEIYEQINAITKRPRLSKREKETVQSLNSALEVSETLIEKEIGDVKEILK
ncbi:cohesin domain-containing protein [bacterium]|nr:cohesin domain-containing protein [bacterium]